MLRIDAPLLTASVAIMTGGYFGFKLSTAVHAYLRVYPHAKSKSGAYASASRFMKHTDARLIRRWLFLESEGRVAFPLPSTVPELIEQSEPLGVIRVVRRLG